ncbi:MAG TPA: hypothetical protein PK200_16460, partial [Spirochaetota bacterium]|nr:hypothetical protein [Spirochaetota bacterium]
MGIMSFEKLRSLIVPVLLTVFIAGCGKGDSERSYDEGLRKLKAGNHAEAINDFTEAINSDPRNS